jgi:hypothetical protein
LVEIFTPKPSETNPFPTQRIRVWPKNEDIRKYIVYPIGNIKFRATIYDSVEWPLDQFTKRRLAKGDILDHPPPKPEPQD